MRIQDEIGKLTYYYPVLGELPPSMQHALLDSAYPVAAGAGGVLFDIETTIQSFVLLTQGSIRAVRSGKERDLLLYRVQPGGCCAISICHLLGDSHYRARAEVETDIRGVALPQPLFRDLMERSTRFNAFVFHALAERFTTLLELLESVTSLHLDERLAGVLATRGPMLQTTHAQLASELGSVREVISRILDDFAARGLIQIERGQIQVLDPETLLLIAQSRGDCR